MGLTPALLLLLGLLAPQLSDETVVYEKCDSYDSYYECEDEVDIYEYPDLTGETFEMNETFTYDNFEYIFTDAYIAEATDITDDYNVEYFGEPDNVLVIDFEFTNIGSSFDSPRYYISLYGDNYYVEEYAYLHSVPEVNPGRSGRGQLIYDLPDGVEVLELEIATYDYITQENVTVNIVVDEE